MSFTPSQLKQLSIRKEFFLALSQYPDHQQLLSEPEVRCQLLHDVLDRIAVPFCIQQRITEFPKSVDIPDLPAEEKRRLNDVILGAIAETIERHRR